jgi:hypothetical protein
MCKRNGKESLLMCVTGAGDGSAIQSNHKLRKAEAQVALIREFYESGKETLEVGKDKAAREEISRKYLIDVNRLGKARRFAERYTAQEVNELCGLRKPDGTPLQVGHLDSLLSLPWETQAERRNRAAIQKEAAEKAWTAPELRAAIKARFPKTRCQSTGGKPVGRPPKPKQIDVLTREIRVRVRDLIHQIRNSNGIDEQYVAELLELQSEVQTIAAIQIQAVPWAA